MSTLIWIGIIFLAIALILGFGVMRGMIRASLGIIKWVIILLLILGIISLVGGWLGWF